MASKRVNRRKKKRANTLDPSSERFAMTARYRLSQSPAPKSKNKLKPSKSSTPRMTKSKSPSGARSKFPKDQIKKKKKTRRRRAGSDADSIALKSSGLTLNLSLGFAEASALNKSTKKKKQKRTAKTPDNDYPGTKYMEVEGNPFGVPNYFPNENGKKKKKNKHPKLNASTTFVEYELATNEITPKKKGKRSRAESARISNFGDRGFDFASSSAESLHTNYYKKLDKVKLENSTSINQGCLYLDSSSTKIRKRINESFKMFHKKLNEKQDKLYEDLEGVYDDKKEELTAAEKILFQNANKKTKKKIIFDPNIELVLDDDKCVKQIEKFGKLKGTDDDDEENDNSAKNNVMVMLSNYAAANNNNDDDSKYNGYSVGESIDDDEGGDGQSVAQKQKQILGGLQSRTMNKLNTIISMEKEAKEKQRLADKLTKEVDESMKYIASRTQEINEKILEAKPELDKARNAVSGIEPKDLNEIKALKSPPKVIETVITATAMILGHKIKEWKDVQRILSYKLKPQLLNFDTYTLTKKQRQKVYKTYVHGNEDFNYDRVYIGNKVCGRLVLWVLSQINYSRLLDVIIPLEKEVKKLKKEAKKKQKLSKTLIQVVKELEINIALYQAQCNEMVQNIIHSTSTQLREFETKLEPLNAKFTSILSNKVLD